MLRNAKVATGLDGKVWLQVSSGGSVITVELKARGDLGAKFLQKWAAEENTMHPPVNGELQVFISKLDEAHDRYVMGEEVLAYTSRIRDIINTFRDERMVGG